MEEPVEKRRRIGSIRGFRVCSQRASFERGHASTVLLITPSAGLLTAHLDGIAEWEVFAYLGSFMCGLKSMCESSTQSQSRRDGPELVERGRLSLAQDPSPGLDLKG
jgi:hypothetical protein